MWEKFLEELGFSYRSFDESVSIWRISLLSTELYESFLTLVEAEVKMLKVSVRKTIVEVSSNGK